MSFSDKIYITKVERREPGDKVEWVAKIARVLLRDRDKHPKDNEIKREESKNE